MVRTAQNVTELQADSGLKELKVRESLKTKDYSLLFTLAVVEYKGAPSKKKAIAIWDLFLGPDKKCIEIGELDSAGKHRNLFFAVAQHIQWYQEERAKAGAMNFIQRAWTAKERKIASPDLFDPLNEAGQINTGTANCAVYGTLSEPREMKALDG